MSKFPLKRTIFTSSPIIVSLLLSSCGSNVQTNYEKAGSKAPSSLSSSSQSNNPTQTNIPVSTPTNASNKKTIKAKGMYLTATSAGARLKHYIDLANTTEINSYVIDYKDDDGYVCVNSSVPAAKEVKAIDVRYDPEKVTKELHANNIYAIARIVCFKDPFFSKGKPAIAIKNKNGGLYIHNGMTWVNAYTKEAWQYNIDLAKEALSKGFDEVQFDYVRFPDGKKSDMVFDSTNNKKMYETIDDFLSEARKQMPSAVLSADVFAIICESPGDNEGIGQYLEYVGKDVDYISPMAYPSHYALGQIINNIPFKKPDLDPYGVIKNTLLKAKARLSKVDGHVPMLRTYIQDFDATWIGQGNWQHYGDDQVRQEIQAVNDAGYDEWFLWDPMNTYHEGALKKE
ncbi:MAG: putative glycoside hydrolase [Bacillota bacterium]|nr:putative glycoside hydrolase [Bacillota bacterium]